jgi:hypothetical protein
VKNFEEDSNRKKTPKRLFFKIPEEYYASSEAEQKAFVEAIYDQILGLAEEDQGDVGKEENS